MANDFSTVEIRGDNDPLKSSLDECVGIFKSFGEKVLSTLSTIFNSINFDSIFGKILKGIDQVEDRNAGLRQLGYALKASKEEAGFNADKLALMRKELKAIGSDDALIKAQRALLGFKNVKGDVFKDALKGAFDLAEVMGTTLPNATQFLGRALQSPLQGLADLKAEGVRFTEVQEKMITSFAKNGMIGEAQKRMLDALRMSYGGAGAQGAATFSAKLEVLTESFGKIWRTIAEKLLPYLTKFIEVVQGAGVVVDFFMTEWIASLGDLGITADTVFAKMGEWFDKIAEAGVYAFTYLQTAIEEWESYFGSAFASVKRVANQAFVYILEVASTTWSAMTEVVGGWLAKAKPYWKEWADYIGDILEMLTFNLDKFSANMQLYLTGQGDKADWDWIDTMSANWDEFGKKKKDAMEAGEDDGKGLFDNIKEQIDKLKQEFMDMVPEDDAFEGFDAAFAENLKNNTEAALNFQQKIKDILSGKLLPNVTGQGKGKYEYDKEVTIPGSMGDTTSRTGAFEDLQALNKRIQGAAAGNPTLKELEKQTAIAKGQAANLAKIADNTKKVAEAKPLNPTDLGKGIELT